jgi:hypothetical protein
LSFPNDRMHPLIFLLLCFPRSEEPRGRAARPLTRHRARPHSGGAGGESQDVPLPGEVRVIPLHSQRHVLHRRRAYHSCKAEEDQLANPCESGAVNGSCPMPMGPGCVARNSTYLLPGSPNDMGVVDVAGTTQHAKPTSRRPLSFDMIRHGEQEAAAGLPRQWSFFGPAMPP